MDGPSMPLGPRPAKTRAARATMTIVAGSDPKGSGDWHSVTFGNVTVTGPRPSAEQIRRNAEASTAALKRALPAFLNPGIRIEPKQDVPLFWADEDNPVDGVIRQLNGKTKRGVVDEDGQFKAVD